MEKDCVITITHKIHFVRDKLSEKKFKDFVDKVKKQLETVWGGEFKYGCCKVKFQFEYSDKAGDDIDDKIIHDGDGVDSQSGLGPKKTTGNWYPEGKQHDKRTPAHEVGHEMGMTDKYVCKNAAGATIPCYVTDANGKRVVNPDFAKTAPTDGYPEDGLAFKPDADAVPKDKDIAEIVDALGIKCPESCCKKKKTAYYIGIGIGVAIAIVVAYSLLSNQVPDSEIETKGVLENFLFALPMKILSVFS